MTRLLYKVPGITLLSLILLAGCSPNDQKILIAAGAGYKKPVEKIRTQYTLETGTGVDVIYGNMQMISQQAQQSGQIAIVIGDLNFLQKSSFSVKFSSFNKLGEGRLVLAYPKNKTMHSPQELTQPGYKRILMPDPRNAIYGKAAMEFLTSEGLWDALQPSLLTVKTVPIVSSFLLTSEADAGFINKTDALAIEDQIGGFLLIETGYTPIEIVAGVVESFASKKEVENFLTYLTDNEQSQAIFKSFGL